MLKPVSSLILIAALGGCAYAPGFHLPDESVGYNPKTQADESAPANLFEITPALIQQLQRGQVASTPSHALDASQGYQYIVGINDVLSVTVWDHPELTIPAGEVRSAEAAGHLVGTDGSIFFPHVGKIPAAGRTVSAIRHDLTNRLAHYIQNPQLDVRVAGFRSQKISVTGEVNQPGIIALNDVPLTLVDAVNRSGGANSNADLRQVTLLRNNKTYEFDLYSMLESGDMRQNYILKHGDIINIPDKLNNKIFVIGEVKEQTSQVMHKGRMSLAEALSAAGGANMASSDTKRIYVIRAAHTQSTPEIFHLSANNPTALLLTTKFQLQPMDVIYVSPAGLTRWNRVVSQILPTVQGLFQLDNVVNN